METNRAFAPSSGSVYKGKAKSNRADAGTVHPRIRHVRRQDRPARFNPRGRVTDAGAVLQTDNGLIWRKQHPAEVLSHKSLLTTAMLPLIPIIPLLVSSPQSVAVTSGLLGQVVLMSSVLIFLTRMWQHNMWAVDNGRICRKKGLIKLDRIDIDTHMITAVEIIRPLSLAAFGTAKMICHTASPDQKSNISMILKKDRASRISNTIMPFISKKEDGKDEDGKVGKMDEYIASMRPVAIMAASDSNFALGLILLIPLVNQIGSAIGQDFRTQLWEEITGGAAEKLPWMPPLFVWVSVLLVLGWMAHFIRNLLVYGNHRTLRCNRTTILAGGVLTRRSVCVPDRCVSALEVRQTVLMRILRRKSCWMLIQGFKSGKHCCLFPAAKESDLSSVLSELFPSSGGDGALIEPSKKDRKKYYGFQLIFAAAVIVLWAVVSLFSQTVVNHSLSTSFTIICTAALIMLLWSALVGAMTAGSSKIHLTGDSVGIVGRRGMSVLSLRVFRGAVSEVKITQNFLRRMAGICDVYIRPKGFKSGITCRFLPYDRAVEIAERLA